MIRENLSKVYQLLDKEARKGFWMLVSLMIMVAIFEFIGIALVLPFIRYARNQFEIDLADNSILKWLSNFEHNKTLVVMGFIIFGMIVFSTILKIYLTWREQSYIWNLSHKLTIKQHRNLIYRPYTYFIEKNSSEIITNLIVETSTTVRGILLPIAQLISNCVIAVLFLSLISYLHFKISLVLILGTLIIASVIIVLFKNSLIKLGKQRLDLERTRFLQLKESIIGIKTVKSNSKEVFFLNKFETVSERYSVIKPFVNTLNSVPRSILDIVLFGGVILLIAILSFLNKDLSNILPILTFYVLVGFKLMPTFQNIISAIITLRFSWPSLKAIKEVLDYKNENQETVKNLNLSFEDRIVIENCTFAYVENEVILRNINLIIPKAQKIGIVGYSGSGKTTLVEIIAGLLLPQAGKLLLDNTEITSENKSALLDKIAFVPQDVFLFDDSIIRNITLRDKPSSEDYQEANTLLDLMNLSEFYTDLPQGLDSRVGEFGVKISGGQKQRLGFARALFAKPEILILDESTSALDYITEQEILYNIKNKLPNLTIIKVAHRLKSVKDCDNIIFIDKGTIIAKGKFDEVIENNSLFKEMVKAGTI